MSSGSWAWTAWGSSASRCCLAQTTLKALLALALSMLSRSDLPDVAHLIAPHSISLLEALSNQMRLGKPCRYLVQS